MHDNKKKDGRLWHHLT